MHSLRRFYEEHPNLSAWIVLAIGMVVIVVWSARSVGFLPGQWAVLILATILLAGLCVWIISWEDEDVEANQRGGESANQRVSEGANQRISE